MLARKRTPAEKRAADLAVFDQFAAAAIPAAVTLLMNRREDGSDAHVAALAWSLAYEMMCARESWHGNKP